jgi:ribosome-associated toxin RatA of RatAB toxin-antitoxin module
MADQTESSIVINASPATIMDVIADLSAYPQWSDGIKEVVVLSVYEEDNRPADVRFNLSSGAIKDIYELEYDWDENQKVSWTLTKGDMLTAMDGTYELGDNGDGTTTVHYKLSVDVKIPMIGMIKRKAEKVIVDTALKGLKKRVESLAREE